MVAWGALEHPTTNREKPPTMPDARVPADGPHPGDLINLPGEPHARVVEVIDYAAGFYSINATRVGGPRDGQHIGLCIPAAQWPRPTEQGHLTCRP